MATLKERVKSLSFALKVIAELPHLAKPGTWEDVSSRVQMLAICQAVAAIELDNPIHKGATT